MLIPVDQQYISVQLIIIDVKIYWKFIQKKNVIQLNYEWSMKNIFE